MTDDPLYLKKHDNGTYYYRRPIIAEDQIFWLAPNGQPKKEWGLSLRTKDRRTAIDRMRDAEDKYGAERAEHLARHLARPASLTIREQEEQAALAAVETARQARFEARQPHRIKARQMMNLATAELNDEQAAWRDLVREWKTEAEAAQESGANLQGAMLADLAVPGFGKPLGAAGNDRTVTQLCDAYIKAKWDGWGGSSRKAISPVVKVLKDTIGDRPVIKIDRVTAREVFEVVKALPVNLGKRKDFAGLTVPQAIAKAKKLSLPTINPNTVNRAYMVQIAAVFNWATEEDWAIKNPFTGLSVADPVDDMDRREPFALDQIKSLFSVAPWDHRPSDDMDKPGRFWVPLIALYTGMRLGEVACLRIMDVEELEGVQAFRVLPHEGRRLKTKESRRTVPIHSALLDIGIMAFVGRRRQQSGPEELLFPDGKANARGQGGAKLGEWFSAHLRARGIIGTKLGMHSFRHNFEDRLKVAGLHGQALGQALAGRKVIGSEADYGSKLPIGLLRQLQEALERVSYPSVDLSHLAWQG